MNFPLYIARRYVLSLSKNNAINIITGIASLGIVVSSMALFIVLSVFSGLKVFSLSFSNSFDPDLKVAPKTGKTLTISPQQWQKINQIEGVEACSRIIEERVLFMFNEKEHVTQIKGIDSIYPQVNNIGKMMFNGQWLEPNTYQCVTGYGVAQKLSVGLFDYNNMLEVYAPRPGKGAIENPEEAFNKATLIPIGIYAVSEELDGKYVFADLGLVQELLQYPNDRVSGVELKLRPGADENTVSESIQKILGGNPEVRNRARQNDSLYRMLNTENLAVYLIFTLVIIVALFNLVGALIMMILDKKANLKTLLSLGTEIGNLRKIFLLQGTMLSIGGGIVGLLLGIGVVYIQQKFQLVMITSSLAYPVVFEWKNAAIVLVTIIALGILASLIAATRVSRNLLD